MTVSVSFDKRLIQEGIIKSAIETWSEYLRITLSGKNKELNLSFDVEEEKLHYVDEFLNYLYEADAAEVMQND